MKVQQDSQLHRHDEPLKGHRVIQQCTRLLWLCTLCVLSMSPMVGRAQVTTADIVGTVTDNTGAILPNVSVSLLSLATQETQEGITTSTGSYIFTLLKPGGYTVKIAIPGFKSFSASITLSAGDRARVDAALQVGPTTETINVEAATPALQSESSTVVALLTERAVQDLPLNGRNFVSLAQVTQGANEGPPKGLSSGTGTGDRRPSTDMSVNGQADLLNNEMIDGMDNNERMQGTIGVRSSIDSIAELRVITNLYPAEVTRTAGGVIEIVSKAGGNEFHGSLFEYLRNDALNAAYYQFGAHNPKPELRQNQYGGSLSGPIYRKRTFFFGDFEGLRLVQGGAPSKVTVPTLYEEQHIGDFSDTGGAVYTGTQLDPVGVNYFKLFPAPNVSTSTNQYVGTQVNRTQSAISDSRLDHQIGSKDAAFVRYTYNGFTEFLPPLLPKATVASLSIYPGGSNSQVQAHGGQIDYVHTFTPNLLMDLKAGYLGIFINETALNYGTAVNSAFGEPNVNIDAQTSGLAPLSVTTATPLGNAGNFLPFAYTDNTFQYMASVIYNRGAHSAKAGISLIRRQATDVGSQYGAGNFTVTSLANLVQGIFSSSVRNYQINPPHLRTWEMGGYAQDDWHMLKGLTLNLGIRYDIYTPYTEVSDHISNFDFANPAAGFLIAGVSHVSSTVNLPTEYMNIAPRIGFAYTPKPGYVIRGGYGITYVPENLNSTAYLSNQPFYATFGPCSSVTCAAPYNRLANGLPLPTVPSTTTITGSVTAAEAPTFRPSEFHQFNLTTQKDFAGNVVTVTYVGMLGRHVVQRIPDFNAPPPNACGQAGNACTSANTLRPYYAAQPGLGQITGIQSEGVSTYHALELVYERRMKKGLTAGANFTWARGLDDAYALARPAGSGDGFGYVPSQIRQLDYGNSDVDVRNRFATTANYELPFGKSLKGIAGLLAKGWQTNMLMVWSGTNPFTVTNAADTSNTNPGAANADRPNQIASWKISNPTSAVFFNPAAFVKQTFGTLGSEHRNQLYSPHYRHTDMSIFKSFPIREKTIVQFRAEAYNIANTTNFNTPNTSLGTATFGQLTSTIPAYNPRVFQLALKVQF
jgi:hypothetical protein